MIPESTNISVADLVEAYLDLGPATRPAKRRISWINDASNLKRHLQPLIGAQPAAKITRLRAAQVLEEIRSGKTSLDEKTCKRGLARVRGGEAVARRTRSVAAALWSWALEHKLIEGSNPFSNLRLGMAPERCRFLSEAELHRFAEALNSLEEEGKVSSTFADALRLLMYTGARKSEILSLRWNEVFLSDGLLRLPAERTKSGGRSGQRRIALSAGASEIISRRWSARKTPSSLYVFPARRGAGPATGLRKRFKEVCARAQLDDFRIHDLRHSFASFALAGGVSLPMISKALGHADMRSTERYTHIDVESLMAVASVVAARVRPAP